MIPHWLHGLSVSMLTLAIGCALLIAADELRRPQRMAIMNIVWPVTALFGSILWLWAYLGYGRLSSAHCFAAAKRSGSEPPAQKVPFAVKIGEATSHRGSDAL